MARWTGTPLVLLSLDKSLQLRLGGLGTASPPLRFVAASAPVPGVATGIAHEAR